ncbi:glycoside hydrolase family 95 protein [Litorilinea aerophila]|uniref:glycoside hydrolase family 95 protein n=1 Tax=Litorilinea aerophila TaxID=1204385 RepID=UPI001B8690A7|nr:glycoside hydrolase family 95 protein [Litorilinea aerophila]MCC9078497.1 glycoside hydrolase family 95 protein [Litorilinea aerophila]
MQDPNLRLWYRQPAARWVEALPIGNGRLAAMVFGGVPSERLQLNEDTLWSGGPRDWNNPAARDALAAVRQAVFAGQYEEADRLARQLQGPFTQSYLPMADLHVHLLHGDGVRSYRRELDLDAAVARASYVVDGVTYTREAFASAPDRVIALRLTCDRPGHLRFVARLESPLRHTVDAPAADTLALRGKAPEHVEPNYRPSDQPIRYAETEPGEGMTFVVYLQVVAEGGQVQTDEAGILRVMDADAATLYVSAATSFNGYRRSPGLDGRDPEPPARQALAQAIAQPYDGLRQRHMDDHRRLFRRVSLDLGQNEAAALPTDERIQRFHRHHDPHLVTLLFQFGRYLLIASSRPGTQPANLQGIWNDQVRPPWSSNYTININTQMNYWPAEVTNLAECHTPLFDFIAELAANGQETARVNYGCSGWVAHHNADLWRQSAPVGNYGEGDPVWACWPMAGPWLCQHLWEHYAFGLDLDFLRDTAYPLMKGAAQFCLDWLLEDGHSHLVTAPSTSPENKFTTPDGQRAAVSMAATMDMALMRDLFTHCCAAAEILDVDGDFRQRLQDALARLYPFQIGRHGQLQEWFQDWDDPDDHHRHASHLLALHPASLITRRETPELWAAARRSLEMRGDGGTGWSMAWKIAFWARLEDGDRAARMIANMLNLATTTGVALEGGGVYPNLFCAHPPFQIDGNFGATAGIAEMLLQSHAGVIHLLPALPGDWRNGSVQGLRARGGLTVDLAWRDGALVEVTLHAARNGRHRLRYGPHEVEFDVWAGQRYRLDGTLQG